MSQNIFISYFKTPVGELILGTFDNQLCIADWRFRKMRTAIDKRIRLYLKTEYEFGKNEVLDQTKLQLSEYFENKRHSFDIPLLLAGTDFQKKVWNALIQIPYGETQTYLGLSKHLGDEKAIRAVATANGANAISILVPCHRIIGSDGKLVGYAGGLPAKKKLLSLENALDESQLSLF